MRPKLSPDVVVAILGFFGVLIAQWTMFCVSMRKAQSGKKLIEEINDAVNHRHERGGAKMYDLILTVHNDVRELSEWRQFDAGPRLKSIEKNVSHLMQQQQHKLRKDANDHDDDPTAIK